MADIIVDGVNKDGPGLATHDTNNETLEGYVVVGGQYDDSLTSLTENQVGSLRLTTERAAHVNLRDASGNDMTLAHDAIDAGGSVKIGAKATDWAPDSDAEQGPTAVAANDRVNISTDLQGCLVERVNARYHVLDNVSTTYDDDPTTATSTGIDCSKYRYLTYCYTVAVAGAPTNIVFQIEVSLDGTNYHALDGAVQTETGAASATAYTVVLCAQKVRMKVTATGTDGGGNNFTVTNAQIYLMN